MNSNSYADDTFKWTFPLSQPTLWLFISDCLSGPDKTVDKLQSVKRWIINKWNLMQQAWKVVWHLSSLLIAIFILSPSATSSCAKKENHTWMDILHYLLLSMLVSRFFFFISYRSSICLLSELHVVSRWNGEIREANMQPEVQALIPQTSDTHTHTRVQYIHTHKLSQMCTIRSKQPLMVFGRQSLCCLIGWWRAGLEGRTGRQKEDEYRSHIKFSCKCVGKM